MSIALYELAGTEDDRLYSAYCWRVRLALRHKGLSFRTVPWRLTDKKAIRFSGQGRVPVLVDGERVVCDSWTIATYLEETYPDRPSLFGGDQGRALSRFVTDWTEKTLHTAIFRLVAADMVAHLHEDDLEYFRDSREDAIGMTLEDYSADRDALLPAFRESLAPLRASLAHAPFLAGETPAWADYAVFGAFQWARSMSPLALLAANDRVWEWRERLLDAFDGDARGTRAHPV